MFPPIVLQVFPSIALLLFWAVYYNVYFALYYCIVYIVKICSLNSYRYVVYYPVEVYFHSKEVHIVILSSIKNYWTIKKILAPTNIMRGFERWSILEQIDRDEEEPEETRKIPSQSHTINKRK